MCLFRLSRYRVLAQHDDPEPNQPDDETQAIHNHQAKRGQDNRDDAGDTDHHAKVVSSLARKAAQPSSRNHKALTSVSPPPPPNPFSTASSVRQTVAA